MGARLAADAQAYKNASEEKKRKDLTQLKGLQEFHHKQMVKENSHLSMVLI